MKNKIIAIAVFGDQVSQRFDCAREILIFEPRKDDTIEQHVIPVDCLNGIQIMRAIVASGAGVIVCGAMPCFYYRMAEASGIEVIETSGSVEMIVDQMMRGESPVAGVQCCHGRRRGHERGVTEDSSNNKNDGR